MQVDSECCGLSEASEGRSEEEPPSTGKTTPPELTCFAVLPGSRTLDCWGPGSFGEARGICREDGSVSEIPS